MSERQPFSPDLIDLVEYEKTLLYCREHGLPPVPVKPIPNVNGLDWTESELQHMRDNRAMAKAIKDRIFPNEEGQK